MPENDPPIQSASDPACASHADAGTDARQEERPRRPPPEPEPIELAVLYQDEYLIAVDKPPGMVVHPTYRNWSGTLLNGLLWHLRDTSTLVEPRIVTRLDKDTSGLVLVALTSDIHTQLQRDFSRHLVTKQYLAIVQGTPDPARGSIALPLARSAADRRRVVVDPGGQESRTNYELLCTEGGRSLVRCELVTGRTHQIRVHLAARGWPVLGDLTYGVAHEGISRQALHAWRLRMPHPATSEALEIEAAIPPDLQRIVAVAQNRTL